MKKRIASLILTTLVIFGSFTNTVFATTVDGESSVSSETEAVKSTHPSVYFTDNANLVTQAEAKVINKDLISKSKDLNLDIVIVTTNDLEARSAMEYCDDWYDYNHYGLDEENSGICLLRYIKPDHSDYEIWISTTGQAIWMFSDSEIDYQIDLIADDIIDGKYNDAFTDFAGNVYDHVTACLEYQKEHVNDDYNNGFTQYGGGYDHYYDYHPRYETAPKTPAQIIGICLIVSACVGLVFALVMILIYKGQLKSVEKATQANLYVKRDTFRLTQNQDIFLYKNVTKTAIPKDTGSSSGHSSTHVGSSGASHGGGGRHI